MQQAEALGVGVAVMPGRKIPRRVAAAVARVLDEGAMKTRAAGLAEELKTWDGPANAAAAIRAFADHV
jgi:UDP:flavonoid glycosyltransferase YjiC (YdhE family)